MKPKSRKLAVGTKKPKITLKESCMLRTLHQISKLEISEIIKSNHQIIKVVRIIFSLFYYFCRFCFITIPRNRSFKSIV